MFESDSPSAADWCHVCHSCVVFIRNKNGETAKDVARKMGQVDCLAVLGGDKGEESVYRILCVTARVMKNRKLTVLIKTYMYSYSYTYVHT